MRIIRCLALISTGLFITISNSFAEKGFSIEGGLIYDLPAGAQNRPYAEMKGGVGYTANFGYDFLERAGLEMGVMHTSHDYQFAIHAGGVLEETADRTTFFLKARTVPFKLEKFELSLAAGVGFFDIAGNRIVQEIEVDDDFSGAGFTGNLDFRYYITKGLAVSIYLGGNIVNYSRYEILSAKTDYGRALPGGDSYNWGLTLYHHIGVPKL